MAGEGGSLALRGWRGLDAGSCRRLLARVRSLGCGGGHVGGRGGSGARQRHLPAEPNQLRGHAPVTAASWGSSRTPSRSHPLTTSFCSTPSTATSTGSSCHCHHMSTLCLRPLPALFRFFSLHSWDSSKCAASLDYVSSE
ncbi:unnamed protein product [Miscanthus lutarioriparius]|uniref:Uncharacterized protein n=1 Tax=Miscanthus lutarioriparius TaxID=422564 RepID=A0A811Q592_9POAL|nr:unnamed protein product [Miscanthus lutarioriparius]